MYQCPFMKARAEKKAKMIAEIDAMFAEMARIDERIAKSQQESKIIRAETREILNRIKVRTASWG